MQIKHLFFIMALQRKPTIRLVHVLKTLVPLSWIVLVWLLNQTWKKKKRREKIKIKTLVSKIFVWGWIGHNGFAISIVPDFNILGADGCNYFYLFLEVVGGRRGGGGWLWVCCFASMDSGFTPFDSEWMPIRWVICVWTCITATGFWCICSSWL